MVNNFLFVQAQQFSLGGSGAIVGATTFTLQSFAGIDGDLITMADFGAKGFMTIEPGNGAQEEQISFTGVTQNANGSATISGVKTVLFIYPYTETAGLAKTHAGAVTVVVTNTAGFYNELVAKNDDATITGKYTFPGGGNAAAPVSGTVYAAPTADLELASKKYVDDVAVSGAPDANTTTKGIVQIPTQAQVDAKTDTGSTGALLVPVPSRARSTKLSDYVADTGAANAYVITPSPAISAYAVGQIFTFKATNTNTTVSTLAVNGFAATTIKKGTGAIDLAPGDITAGQIVMVEYDGTNFQMISNLGNGEAAPKFGGTGANGALAISSGTTTVDLGNAKVFTLNYTSISITGTAQLAFSNPNAAGTLVIIKSQGNITLTSSATPMINCAGLGAAAATEPNLVFDGVTHKGATGNVGSANSSGTGGAGGAAQSTVGLIYTNQDQYASVLATLACRGIIMVPGAGGGTGGAGGNGSASNGAAGGAGGRGGGALLIECRGAWNFTTALGISVAGAVGTAGADAGDVATGSAGGGGGGGGGGAGGNCIILYNTLTSNAGTVNVLGGAGGAGGTGGDSAAGTGNGGGGGGSGGTAAAAFTALANASGAGGAGGNDNTNGVVGSNGGANGHGAGGGGGAGSADAVPNTGGAGGTGGAALAASGSSLVLANVEFA